MRRFRSRALLPALVPFLLLAAACTPSTINPRVTTVASVDVSRYLGTWFEIASVKQFFSVGLVDTTANYSVRPDGTILVVNSGRYFGKDGPISTVVGSAFPVDGTNTKLNVSFTGTNSATPPGNYWIVALDPNYQWAVVSDPTGLSAFILSRTPTIPPALKADLIARAVAAGVDTSNLTDTPQP